MKILTAISVLAISCAAAFAQTVETGFYPAEIRPGGYATYRVTLKNADGASVNPSDIPVPAGLEIAGTSRSQNYSFINGKMSSSVTLDFAMAAGKEGEYTVPAWKIPLGSKSLDAAPATLKVSASAPAAAPQRMSGFPSFAAPARRQSHAYDDSFKNSITLELKLPREKIYVGETIKCELVLSFDKSLFENGYRLAQALPQIKNMDAFECPAFTGEPEIDMRRDPEKALVIYRTVITPLKAGEYDLEFSAAGILNREISIDDIMGMSMMDRLLSMGSGRRMRFDAPMKPVKLKILPLPADGKPKNFTGAIGKFELAEVSVSPDALSVGEPCTIVAKIAGTGNFNRMNAPALDGARDWKTYKPKSSFTDESGNQGYIGVKTFEYTAVPKAADLPQAPRVAFNYFDPEAGKYVEELSKPVAVSVAPTIRSKTVREAQEEAAKPAPAFSKISEGVRTENSAGIFSSGWFWISQAAILAAAAVFVAHRLRARRLETDPAYAKKTEYSAKARAALREALASADSPDAKKFFSAARESLRYALAAGSPEEARSLSLKDALARAEGIGLGGAQTAAIKAVFDGADALEFGGGEAGASGMGELAKSLAETVRQILK
ncbi:MAG: BatD family protein [Opitutales bacterium]|nr:BatD family protein [Opitutales bacterium]